MDKQDNIPGQNAKEWSDKITNAKQYWLASSDTATSQHKPQNKEEDEKFKKQHQQYIALKMKRLESIRQKKIINHGDSSSDSDEPIHHPSIRTQLKPALQLVEKPQIKHLETQRTENINQTHPKKAKIPLSKSQQTIAEKYQILVHSKKGSDNWIEQNMIFKQKLITIASIECPIYNISKLKLIFETVEGKNHKLKYCWNGEEFYLAISYVEKQMEMPLCFYVFAKTIAEKLGLMGKKLNSYFSIKEHKGPQKVVNNCQIYGRMLKKSRIKGWSEIYAAINKDGLMYFKKESDKKSSMLIPMASMTELWTRFEFIEDLIVIKMFKESSKIQLAIPVYDFLDEEGWLFNFYKLHHSKK